MMQYCRIQIVVPSSFIVGLVGVCDVNYNFFGNDCHSSKHERHKEVHVDVVPSTVKLPEN